LLLMSVLLLVALAVAGVSRLLGVLCVYVCVCVCVRACVCMCVCMCVPTSPDPDCAPHSIGNRRATERRDERGGRGGR
jgi:hypothetical protein